MKFTLFIQFFMTNGITNKCRHEVKFEPLLTSKHESVHLKKNNTSSQKHKTCTITTALMQVRTGLSIVALQKITGSFSRLFPLMESHSSPPLWYVPSRRGLQKSARSWIGCTGLSPHMPHWLRDWNLGQLKKRQKIIIIVLEQE